MAEDLEIKYRDPAGLVPYGKNARTHSAEQVRSIDEFGFVNPILLRDDEQSIGAGHGRQMAALLKPALTRVPTVSIPGLTDDQWKALILADNKLAMNAGWDEGLLKLELADLQGAGFDLSLTGFGSLELTSIFSTQEGRTDPDDTPEPPATPVSQLGDLWRLGDHWLICGDSTDPKTVERVLQAQKPHLMVTDPPYGVNYDPAWRNTALRKDGSKIGARATGQVANDDRADWREAWALFPGDVAYVWHGGLSSDLVAESLESVGFEKRAQIIWNKTVMVIGRGHYHPKHEPCWYAVRKGGTGHWSGDRKQTTVWDIDHRKSETGHGTQKPVEAMARPIRNNSQPGDRVYEPFAGSGTTVIAAQMNKRICHAIELSPAYVDVILKRFEAFTGTAPTLADTGETFEAVKARRAAVDVV